MIKYCVIKHLILPKIQKVMDINEVFLQWFIILLIKSSGIKNEIIFNKALAEELHK